MIDPIDTRDIYLKADIDFANERGKIRQTVVTTACTTLNNFISVLPGIPVTSVDTPKLLQTMTNSLVTKKVKVNFFLIFLLMI